MVFVKAADSALANQDGPPTFTRFALRTQLVAQGRTDKVIAENERMQLRVKVYASGGENGLHAHANEDHTFLVMQGRARFFDKDDNPTEVGRNEGIFIPAYAYYRFEAISQDEELVLFRVGSKITDKSGLQRPPRLDITGRAMPGHDPANKEEPLILKEGRFFG